MADEEELDELLGEDLASSGTPETVKEPGAEADQGKGKDAPGTPGDDREDARDDVDVRDLLRSERRAKKKLEDRLRRMSGESTEMRKRLRDLEEQQRAILDESLERRSRSVADSVREAQARLRKAIDEQDPDAEVQAQRDLAEAVAAEREAKQKIESARQELRKPLPQEREQTEDAAGPNDLAQAWMERNPWFVNGGSDKDSQVAARASQYVASLGFDPDDPRHFEELDKHLRVSLPHRFKTADLPATRGSSRMNARPREPKGLPEHLGDVHLTPLEIKAYKAMGLDLDYSKDEDQIRMRQYKYETQNSERNARKRA